MENVYKGRKRYTFSCMTQDIVVRLFLNLWDVWSSCLPTRDHMKTIIWSFFHDCKYCDVASCFSFYNGAERHVVSADKTGRLLSRSSEEEFKNKQLWQKSFTRTTNQCQTLAAISHTADYAINPQSGRNSFMWKQTCNDIVLPWTRTRNQSADGASVRTPSNRCSASAAPKSFYRFERRFDVYFELIDWRVEKPYHLSNRCKTSQPSLV